MSRVNSQGGTQEFAFDDIDAGEGVAVFFSQGGEAVGRYRFILKAIIDEGMYDVGEFYSSPPGATDIPGRLSRMIAGAVCPGAKSWRVAVTPVKDFEGLLPSDETAEVILASTRCYAQMGVTRVAERYNYVANFGTTSFRILAGMRVTGITALGLPGDGSVTIGGGDTILVPDGISVNLEPGASIVPNTNIAFGNCDWVIEYMESA